MPLVSPLAMPLCPVLLPPMPANAALSADVPGLLSIAAALVLTLFGMSHSVHGLRAPSFWAPIFPMAHVRRGPFQVAIV